MIRLTLLIVAIGHTFLALASGCAAVHPTVPVVEDAGDAAALVGVWEGDYRSHDTGRDGVIFFELSTAPDSAGHEVGAGEVVMTYFGETVSFYPSDDDRWPVGLGPHYVVELLTIQFVRLGEDRVSGTLDPYPNPTCSCTLYTAFEGTVSEDTIVGTFVSRSPEHGHVQRGTWRVARR